MIHATWGDWFITEEVEAAEPDGLSLWYLGCNGFIVRSPENTVYVDPYFGDGEPPWTVRMIPVPMNPVDAEVCDAVLITHEHIDHMHPPSYEPFITNLGAEVYAPEASYRESAHELSDEIPDAKRNVVTAGDTVDIGDLTVHVRSGHDPDAIEPVSYIIEHQSGTYFNGGDSRPAPFFGEIGREFDIDVGSLTFGSVGRIRQGAETRPRRWYSDENDVVALANTLELERLLPVHWDTWKGVGGNPTSLHEHAASFSYPRTIDPVTVGDRIDVDRPGIVPLRSLEK